MSTLDAKEASKIVRQYFFDIHGPFGVWGFEVESVTPLDKGGWLVTCSFAPTMMGSPRYRYEIQVPETGTVGEVRRRDAEPTVQ